MDYLYSELSAKKIQKQLDGPGVWNVNRSNTATPGDTRKERGSNVNDYRLLSNDYQSIETDYCTPERMIFSSLPTPNDCSYILPAPAAHLGSSSRELLLRTLHEATIKSFDRRTTPSVLGASA